MGKVKEQETEVQETATFRVTSLRVTAEHRANSMAGDSIDRRYVECAGEVEGVVFSVEAGTEEDALIALETLVKSVSERLGIGLSGEIVQQPKQKVKVV